MQFHVNVFLSNAQKLYPPGKTSLFGLFAGFFAEAPANWVKNGEIFA
jgi:hypothetical protein